MAAQVQQHYIPMMWNHDIRFPPLGRVVTARIVDLPDGEKGLETESETWEPGDDIASLAGDGREIRLATDDVDVFEVRIDRSLGGPSDYEAATSIARIAGPERSTVEVGKR